MHKIVFVQPLSEKKVKLRFADGLEKTVDITPFIGKGISKALADADFFARVEIESGGGIYWPNGFDFCPNFLHDEVPAIDLSPA